MLLLPSVFAALAVAVLGGPKRGKALLLCVLLLLSVFAALAVAVLGGPKRGKINDGTNKRRN